MGKKSRVVRKNLPTGEPNPKYVDVLTEDRPLAGQSYCVMSFISPENILKDKNLFFFEEFVKQWEFAKSMEKFHQFLQFVSYKYKLHVEDVWKDYEEYVKEERDILVKSSLDGEYKTFLERKEEDLTKQFSKKHNFQTCVRAVKNSGNFSTLEEAEMRAKLIRDANKYVDVSVGPVGMYLVCDPDAYKTGRTEHAEEELNQLMHEKIKNHEFSKQEFDERIRDSKIQAIQSNKDNAEKYGNKITQDVDEDGNTYGVNVSNFSHDQTEVTAKDIHRMVFEEDNVIPDKPN